MALTYNDQFGGLVVFSAAALVLLLLSHAADERSSWLRHRIWRGRDFETPHLEGGLAFASVAVAGSLILTMVASSAPLGSVMDGLSSDVQSAFNGLSGYLPGGGVSRIQGGSDFGSTATIQSVFRETTREVFTVRVQAGQAIHHWRMYTYDTFQRISWSVGPDSRKDNVLAGGQLDGGTLELVSANATGRKPATVTVHILDTSIKHLIVPNEPDNVNAGVERTLVGSGPSNSSVATVTSNAKDYTVVAYVPDIATDGTGLTEWRLQHAGTAFPPDLLARYTQGVSLVGSDGRGLLAEIKTWAQTNANGFDNEYDVAKAIQTYLHGPSFTYNTDLSAKMPRCAGLSTVDCFAYIREGFCEQYATTMAMLMRMQGFPARWVQGYLPGAIDPHTQIQVVTTQQKHAWVEVYFPTYGWIPFDPTGGGVGAPTVLAPGSAVSPTPIPSTTLEPNDTGVGNLPTGTPSSGAGGSTTPDDSRGPLFLVPLILIAVILLALFVLWRRRSRRLEGPDAVYRNVVKLATRLGYRPRPTQTVFEYTGMLADIVPQARDSLGIVAVATTEVTYGRQQLSTERLIFLATAHHIVRQALLGLAFRLPRLRRGGKGAGATAGRKGTTGRTRS
jgi:transglutaminase-like putative cysteine protease